MPKAELLPDDGMPSFPIVDPKVTEAAQRILKCFQKGQSLTKDTLPKLLEDAKFVSESTVRLHYELMEHAKTVLPLLRSLDKSLDKKRSKEKPSSN